VNEFVAGILSPRSADQRLARPISPPIQAKKSVVPFLYTASLLRPRRACAGPLLLDDRLLHLVRRARQSCSSPKNALPLLLSWGAPPDPSGECALSSPSRFTPIPGRAALFASNARLPYHPNPRVPILCYRCWCCCRHGRYY
jgi:hypothetical protein